jgi:predicted YcjX-like family ATPase
VSLFSTIGSTALRLGGLQGQAPWNVFSATVRIGVTGLSRAGKTAFLTSMAANLLARPQPRFALAPLDAGDVPRFDHAAHLAALAADPPRWPERTNTVSMLTLAATKSQTLLPDRRIRLEFLDYPGEWLLDLPLLTLSFTDWSRATLRRRRVWHP